MVECKAVIDEYIKNGHDLKSVDCIQICGREITISNLTLSAPEVYVANEIYHGNIVNSLQNMDKMIEVALNLLCFRDNVIKIQNKITEEKNDITNSENSIKGRKYNKHTNETPRKSDKESWTRGTWVAFRGNKRIRRCHQLSLPYKKFKKITTSYTDR